MSRHRRVLHDATPAGLPRWLRAADNAVRNPNSPGARLYHGRVSMAHQLRSTGLYAGPVVFFSWSDKREYTCSIFCAAMHAQLRYMVEFRTDQQGTKLVTWQGQQHEVRNYVRVPEPVTLERLIKFFCDDRRVEQLADSGIQLRRPASCVVCRTPVRS